MIPEERHRIAVGEACLALVLHRPAGRHRAPCVVACHGLRASKDSDKYLLLGAELPAAGLALARFDFRGCGESSGEERATTVASRIEDVHAVLAALGNHPGLDGRFGLLGSSLGGFVALHVAAARGDGTPVVTWNAPADLDRLREPSGDSAEGLGEPFLGELRGRRYATTPAGISRHLIIHGQDDAVVPVEHGRALFARAAEPRELLVIAGADHRLTEPVHRKEAVARSLEWFRRFLGEEPS